VRLGVESLEERTILSTLVGAPLLFAAPAQVASPAPGLPSSDTSSDNAGLSQLLDDIRQLPAPPADSAGPVTPMRTPVPDPSGDAMAPSNLARVFAPPHPGLTDLNPNVGLANPPDDGALHITPSRTPAAPPPRNATPTSDSLQAVPAPGAGGSEAFFAPPSPTGSASASTLSVDAVRFDESRAEAAPRWSVQVHADAETALRAYTDSSSEPTFDLALPSPSAVPYAEAAAVAAGVPEADVSDGALLQRFVAEREEAAFTALVARHERLVLGICQRVLGDSHAAQDAVQATFVMLARKAALLDPRFPLAGWLYKVAYHLALRLRAVAARRRHSETAAARARASRSAGDSGTDLETQEVHQVVREELHRLPDKYRVPLVLCYLDGRTHDEAARAIGMPRGSIAKRIGEALSRLRERLIDRGISF
jgi:RNA polymerase sigma factor (sigma-70 family)